MKKIVAFGLIVATCAACAPTSRNFLNDAAATCGSRNLFNPARDFEATTTRPQVDRTYGCVDDYLRHSPEYKAAETNAETDAAADAAYIAAVRQIDYARATGQLTAPQAQAQAQAAAARRGL